MTPFEPYFAELQTSLEGLTKNIFMALNRCVGFIAVMHQRGRVDSPGNPIRASVWVEQEIAIAAFMRETLGMKFKVAAYAQESIALEGIRQQLLLNPKVFTNNSEVLDHLSLVLPLWKSSTEHESGAAIDISIEYEKEHITGDRHDYRLIVLLTNRGNKPVAEYHVDLEFPKGLIEPSQDHEYLVKDRCTRSHSFFRITHENQPGNIFPGDKRRIMTLNYYVDNAIYSNKDELNKIVQATLYMEGAPPSVVKKSIAELQCF